MERQLVVFDLDNEHCGVDIAAVEGIIKTRSITVAPHTPAFMRAIAKVDERLIILVELSKVLSTDEQAGLRSMPKA